MFIDSHRRDCLWGHPADPYPSIVSQFEIERGPPAAVVQNQHTRELISARLKDVAQTDTQQQRPELSRLRAG